MEEFVSGETVKEKLIIAGLTELETHGVSDFSLRRVASLCNVSCAAPYKHFESKERFISEILNFVDNQWIVLYNQIMEIFECDKKRQLMEVCIAFVRFCSGNTHFRSVFMMNIEKNIGKLNITECISDLADKYFCDIDKAQRKQKVFKINSMVLGAVAMSSNNTQTNSEILANLKNTLETEL
jgi:AcrR family transcriptional regulator